MKYWSMFPLKLRRFGVELQFWGENQDKRESLYELVEGGILYIWDFSYLSYLKYKMHPYSKCITFLPQH